MAVTKDAGTYPNDHVKRSYDDILTRRITQVIEEKRQLGATVASVPYVISEIMEAIKKAGAADGENRNSIITLEMVVQSGEEYQRIPNFNCAVCHKKHTKGKRAFIRAIRTTPGSHNNY